jgi:hypothetical protein
MDMEDDALPEVAHAVAEGILIARSALTMAIKNHIIIGAISEDRSYDADEVAAFARDEIRQLAAEESGYAVRVRESAVSAVAAHGPSQHRHDYRAADETALLHREAIYHGLAAELLALSEDAAYVADVVNVARVNAWDEIGDALLARLERLEQIGSAPDYEKRRKKRLRQLKRIDLGALRKV